MGTGLYEEEHDTSRLHHDRIMLFVEISSICVCIGLFIISIYLVVIDIVGVGIGLAIISSGYCIWSIYEVKLDLAPRLLRIDDEGVILKSNILLDTKRHTESIIRREKISGIEIARNIRNQDPYLITIQYLRNSSEERYQHIQL